MEGGPRRNGSADARPVRRGFRGTAENAKTKICLRWLAGNCTYAERCNFAHGETELRQLPPRSPGGPQGGRGRGRGGYDMAYRDGPQYGGGRGQGYGGRGPRPYNDHAGGGGRGGGAGRDAWIASGKPVHGPDGWTQYETPDTGEKYYHHAPTGVTQWDKPEGWVD